MKTFSIVALSAYIAFWVALSIGNVGDSYQGGIYEWTLVPNFFLLLVVPAILGYIIGVNDHD